ncbi:MAG: LysR family transcriptional regulator [Kofleriaceae bacterium]
MSLRGIDVNLVVALHALLKERSVTRAAKRLRLGQSAVSHALGRLRRQFADPLLLQVGRQMVLTERARSLLGPVQDAVARLEHVFLHTRTFDPRTTSRTFRVAATDNLSFYLLPRLAARLATEAPQVAIRVEHLEAAWASQLAAGDLDLKLGREYPVADGLRSEHLRIERLVCVVARDHPLRKRRITLAEYAELRHLAFLAGTPGSELAASSIDERLREHGLRRRVIMTLEHLLVAPFVVAASDLALTASERIVQPFMRSLRLRRLELPIALRSYGLSQVWSERVDQDAGHQWLRRTIASVLSEPESDR